MLCKTFCLGILAVFIVFKVRGDEEWALVDPEEEPQGTIYLQRYKDIWTLSDISIQIPVSGTIVLDATHYPFVAYLIADISNEFICGGAVVSAFFIITTADCLVEPWSQQIIVLNIFKYYVGAGDSKSQKLG